MLEAICDGGESNLSTLEVVSWLDTEFIMGIHRYLSLICEASKNLENLFQLLFYQENIHVNQRQIIQAREDDLAVSRDGPQYVICWEAFSICIDIFIWPTAVPPAKIESEF